MPLDKNEAPEGYEAINGSHCDGCVFCVNHFCIYRKTYSKAPNCVPERRLDGRHVYFIKKESEKTMEEYEYCKAGTHEEWRTIVDAIFRGDCEIKRSVVKSEGTRGIAVSVVWDRATHIENGREYRWKKPAPPKVKKLVDRTPEEFWPLIGRFWWRRKDQFNQQRLLITDSYFRKQEDFEIALLGSEEWQPMQKEIEVEG
jgi:hypothetical protein